VEIYIGHKKADKMKRGAEGVNFHLIGFFVPIVSQTYGGGLRPPEKLRVFFVVQKKPS
jgi:hypothetical protein